LAAREIFAAAYFLEISIVGDLFDYIFEFPDQAAALRDSIVGQYFNNPPQGAPLEMLVYKDTRVNSVSPESGYWFLIETLGPTAALSSHPNVQIINDRTAQLAGLPSAAASFDVSHANILFSNFGVYTNNLLVLVGCAPSPFPFALSREL
jgi:hypothetical protein